MFCDILVLVDGSAHARRALVEAIDLAAAGRGRLTLLTALAQMPAFAFAPADAATAQAIAEEPERYAEEVLREARELVPADVPVTPLLCRTPIRAAVTSEFERGHHDLVVMGSRGHGAVASAVLGSVSHFVLHHSPVPVLIVHADRPTSASSRTRTRRLTLAIHDQDESNLFPRSAPTSALDSSIHICRAAPPATGP